MIYNFMGKRIDPSELFGREAETLLKACEEVFESWVNRLGDQKAGQDDKQFRSIFGICKRHRIYLKWCGNSVPTCGDQWLVYQKGMCIARIQV